MSTTRIILALSATLVLTGCWKDDMADGAHAKPMEPSTFFSDGKLARPLINGTVPRGHKTINDPIYAVTNAPAGTEATNFPFALTANDLEIGRRQFTIFCTPCHGALGDGNGMIVQRGFPRPPSFYEQRLRNAAPGHFYNVVTHGYGAMYSYAERIRPDDRWRVAGYVRALQLSTDRIDPPVNTAARRLPATTQATPRQDVTQ